MIKTEGGAGLRLVSFALLTSLLLAGLVGSIVVKADTSNLVESPNAWTTSYTGMHYGIGGVSNVVLDEAVLYLGESSVRIDPVGSSGNTAREANSYYLSVATGDVITYSVWIKTGESSFGDVDLNSGGRIGIDFYGTSGRIGASQSPDGDPSWVAGVWDDQTYRNYVNWGEDWTKVTMSFTVPDVFPADLWCASGYTSSEYYEPTAIIPWLQVWSSTYGAADEGSVWFAASELYINNVLADVPLGGGSGGFVPAPTVTDPPVSSDEPTVPTSESSVSMLPALLIVGFLVLATKNNKRRKR